MSSAELDSIKKGKKKTIDAKKARTKLAEYLG
jgi:hypothetical protein